VIGDGVQLGQNAEDVGEADDQGKSDWGKHGQTKDETKNYKHNKTNRWDKSEVMDSTRWLFLVENILQLPSFFLILCYTEIYWNFNLEYYWSMCAVTILTVYLHVQALCSKLKCFFEPSYLAPFSSFLYLYVSDSSLIPQFPSVRKQNEVFEMFSLFVKKKSLIKSQVLVWIPRFQDPKKPKKRLFLHIKAL